MDLRPFLVGRTCSQHARNNCLGVSCASLVPLGMKWACICAGNGCCVWWCLCEREGIVGGDEGPVGGVAQVVCHGVKVGVHGEEGQEEDGEMRGEVKREVEQLREKRSSWMVCG